jgi:hypothetical protein
MNTPCAIGFLLVMLQLLPSSLHSQDSLTFDGQVSLWLNVNPSLDLPLYTGGRYLPQVNLFKPLQHDRQLDMELSANLNGSIGFHPFDTSYATGMIKPYRAWVRYTASQFELRAGLQKLNFGSATMFRPLMWFDQLDPRDPLQLTDGVWGILARYYFLNNANIWLWGLYGNTKARGWDPVKTSKGYPEAGGRIQLPVPSGEIAFTYHYRMADSGGLEPIPDISGIPEHRVGFDVRLDLTLGLWLEGSWIHRTEAIDLATNQEIFTAGLDYTFGLGNGLTVIGEHMIAASDETAFSFENLLSLSGLSVSYPVGMFDNLSGFFYYDWTNKAIYNTITWQKKYDRILLYLMAYWNPENYQMLIRQDAQNLYSGKGLQIMFVFNH